MLAAVPIGATQTPLVNTREFRAHEWLPEILNFVKDFDAQSKPRPTAVLDFYCGEKMVSRRAQRLGYSTECFDIKHNPAQDVLSYDGFFLGLLLVCQVQMFGLAVFGPQCSLWLSFMSQSVHERAKLGVRGAFHKINVFGFPQTNPMRILVWATRGNPTEGFPFDLASGPPPIRVSSRVI